MGAIETLYVTEVATAGEASCSSISVEFEVVLVIATVVVIVDVLLMV